MKKKKAYCVANAGTVVFTDFSVGGKTAIACRGVPASIHLYCQTKAATLKRPETTRTLL